MVQLHGDDFGDPSELEGFSQNKPGRYHATIAGFDDSLTVEADKVIVNFTLLAGTTPGEENKNYREYFGIATDKARKRLWRLAKVCGIIGDDHIAAKQNIELTAQHFMGRQLVIELVEDEYQGKKRAKMDYFGMYALTDPATSAVPRNQAALNVLRQHGIPCDPPGGLQAPGQQQQQAPPAQQQQPVQQAPPVQQQAPFQQPVQQSPPAQPAQQWQHPPGTNGGGAAPVQGQNPPLQTAPPVPGGVADKFSQFGM